MADIRFQVKNGLNVKGGALTVNTSTNRMGMNTHAPAVSFEIQTTDAIRLPSGNTSLRPLGSNGYIRYNTEIGLFEGFTTVGWGPISGVLGGANTQVIFNDSGNTSGSSAFTYDKNTGKLTVGTSTVNSSAIIIGAGSATYGPTLTTYGANVAIGVNGMGVGTTSYTSNGINWASGSLTSTQYSGNANTATYATSAGSATSATSATTATNATNAGYATNAGHANQSDGMAGQSYTYFLNAANLGGVLPNGGLSGGNYSPAYITATTQLYCYGNVLAGGDVYAGYSDLRLKMGFEPLKHALYKVCQLNGQTYYQNEVADALGYNNHKKQVGLIAQELQKVLPEAVGPAAIEFDTPTGENYLTIKYDRVIPLLVEAIKELKAELDDLKRAK